MHQQPQGQMMMQSQVQSGLPPLYPNGSPQRRFLSEGELLSRTTSNGLSIGGELTYVNRNNNTVDNIRELAGSPQRGVYNWKDNSPPGQNPTSSAMYISAQQNQQMSMGQNNLVMGRPPLPASMSNMSQQQQQQYLQQNQNMNVVTSSQSQQQPIISRQSNVSNIINNIVANSSSGGATYHPALRGGVQVFPPAQITNASPQVKRKQTPTRPISFVRALEMANSIEMTNVQQQQQQQQIQQQQSIEQMQQVDLNKSNNGGEQQQMPDRGSVYDMGVNYEISV